MTPPVSVLFWKRCVGKREVTTTTTTMPAVHQCQARGGTPIVFWHCNTLYVVPILVRCWMSRQCRECCRLRRRWKSLSLREGRPHTMFPRVLSHSDGRTQNKTGEDLIGWDPFWVRLAAYDEASLPEKSLISHEGRTPGFGVWVMKKNHATARCRRERDPDR